MTFQKGVKFRIYPNREQRNLIDRTLGCSRLIYNKGLAMREDAFKSGEKCSYKQTSAMLTALKQDVNYAFLKEVDSIALQQALRNLDTGYTNFFEHRAAHPKFKSKKSSKQSYRTLNIELKAKLLSYGIAIRNCENYPGLNEYFVRFAVRTREENDELIDALTEILA